MALLQKTLDGQAQLWAYLDVFRDMAIVCALCIPVTFVLKRVQGKAAAAA